MNSRIFRGLTFRSDCRPVIATPILHPEKPTSDESTKRFDLPKLVRAGVVLSQKMQERTRRMRSSPNLGQITAKASVTLPLMFSDIAGATRPEIEVDLEDNHRYQRAKCVLVVSANADDCRKGRISSAAGPRATTIRSRLPASCWRVKTKLSRSLPRDAAGNFLSQAEAVATFGLAPRHLSQRRRCNLELQVTNARSTEGGLHRTVARPSIPESQ